VQPNKMPKQIHWDEGRTMLQLIIASVLFMGGHVLISSTALRGVLISWMGERWYLGFYSLLALVTLIFLIFSYNGVAHSEFLWLPSPELRWLPLLLMPFALILMVGGLMSANPALVGSEGLARDFGQGKGMIRITRHGFLWAVFLWAVTHMMANGDQASLVFFSSFAALSLLGTFLIDRKKAISLGENWPHFATVTSNMPFVAIIQGRNRLVLRELWLPIVIGLVLYAVLLTHHIWISGVAL